jgi:hypothetical protein
LPDCSTGLLLPGIPRDYSMSIPSEGTKITKPKFWFVIGRVDYEDANNSYWTIVCKYYDPDLKSFSDCGPGISDEGTKQKD